MLRSLQWKTKDVLLHARHHETPRWDAIFPTACGGKWREGEATVDVWWKGQVAVNAQFGCDAAVDVGGGEFESGVDGAMARLFSSGGGGDVLLLVAAEDLLSSLLRTVASKVPPTPPEETATGVSALGNPVILGEAAIATASEELFIGRELRVGGASRGVRRRRRSNSGRPMFVAHLHPSRGWVFLLQRLFRASHAAGSGLLAPGISAIRRKGNGRCLERRRGRGELGAGGRESNQIDDGRWGAFLHPPYSHMLWPWGSEGGLRCALLGSSLAQIHRRGRSSNEGWSNILGLSDRGDNISECLITPVDAIFIINASPI